MSKNHSVGVFDSGLGGLTVVRAIQKTLPNENIVYFGDIARLPYGIKSKKQIIEFSKENTRFLLKKKIKALVVACNSSASVCLPTLKKEFSGPLVDVIKPAARQAHRASLKGRVGILGTAATIESGAYKKALQRLNGKVTIREVACPLFVPLAETGWHRGAITESIARTYLKPLLEAKVDTIILGCTHYPLLHNVIKRVVGPKITLIDSAPSASQVLKESLKRQDLTSSRTVKGKLEVYVSDLPRDFVRLGERFLGHKIGRIRTVSI